MKFWDASVVVGCSKRSLAFLAFLAPLGFLGPLASLGPSSPSWASSAPLAY